MRKITFFAIMAILFCTQILGIQGHATVLKSGSQNQIVLVADLSGSMVQADKEQYIKDALKLGVDLAPYDAQIALVTVSDKVVIATELMDIGVEDERAELKTSIDQITYKGNTNFGAGLYKALEILQSSGSVGGDRRIIFLGDFAEGGYTTRSTTTEQEKEIDALNRFAEEAKNQNIHVDLVFVREPPDGNVISPYVLDLANKTGGQVFRLLDAADFPKAIQSILFSSFPYLRSVVPVEALLAKKSIDIPMPTDYVNRARIYIAASSPVTDVKASYAGAALGGEFNRSYSMIWLDRPARDGIRLSLDAGADSTADIYLLLEYTPSFYLSVSHEMVLPEGEKEAVQVTSLTAEIRDAQSQQPLLSSPFPQQFTYSVQLMGSDGEEIELERNPDNPYQYTFIPPSYGSYSAAAQLTIDDVVIDVSSGNVKIEDIRPVEEPVNWSLIIAMSIGCLLILSGLMIALRIKKKEAEYQGAVEMSSDYRFHGKLSIYAVMLEGGNREIRPFDFRLHALSDKRVTLRNILDSVNEKDTYEGAENILLLVGPEESIVVRNNSHATIRMMGRNFEYRTSTQLFYDQKCYIIFDKDENELEIKYCRVKEEGPAPMQFNIRSNRARS